MAYQQQSYTFDAGRLGLIEGLSLSLRNEPAVRYFGGLPYALPPTGEYRFRAPRKLPKEFKYGTVSNPGRFTGGTAICPQPPARTPQNKALFDEDCLQLNMWIPAEPAPKKGWPVCVYFHGGFLQVGSANWGPASLGPLLKESAFRAIMVFPAYRLNAFGFLAGEELASEAKKNGETHSNMGLWDQRTALEWTYTNISVFGGDPSNITAAGYSAGGFSAFQQLAHELYCVPEEARIIKRIAMLSNGPGVAPKTLAEQQKQFNEYITRLGISLELPSAEKLNALRSLPYLKLVEVQRDMEIHEFRLVDDGAFLPKNLMSKVDDGDFGKKMKQAGITLLSGECKDEHTIYRTWRTPENSYDAVFSRFCAEFPESAVQKLMGHYCGADKELPSDYDDWKDFFGQTYANLQVHALQRGLHNALFRGGLVPGVDVLRYRFDKRLRCIDGTYPPELGVTHSSDVPIWFWGANFSGGLTDQEKSWLGGWNLGFAAFVKGDGVIWGPKQHKEMRRWRSDGETDVWTDDKWQMGLEIWDLLNKP
ncbi:carboxylesterase [Colletotrichum graminicola]|uniref:Carboxylesterase n=1 Tax=Colletotrichum graminicola (strain M1.001 / M2 / FGSC 10212) TaxID=645133 RepID=E3QY04_COLGM|nr:carboxylesterase [Colletotrichum graminicola M1.001]EFQ35742.1 carboxylesterase [Colletotrichum graminicola M1.001]WDK10313.1 carboxylesterase [Colletotrichum graminicola]